MPVVADSDVARRIADETQFGEIDANLLWLRQGPHDYARIEDRDDGAILLCLFLEILDGLQAAGARHILCDEFGFAGDILTHIACYKPAVGVESAARRESNYDGDRFALVEIGGAGSGDAGSADDQCCRGNRDELKFYTHYLLPLPN